VSAASFLVGNSLVDTALLGIDQTEVLSVTASILLWVVSQGSATFLVGVDEILSTAGLVTGSAEDLGATAIVDCVVVGIVTATRGQTSTSRDDGARATGLRFGLVTLS